jgi:hypothetical protein
MLVRVLTCDLSRLVLEPRLGVLRFSGSWKIAGEDVTGNPLQQCGVWSLKPFAAA